MAYIGREAIYGSYEFQTLTPNSSTTTFNLAYGVGTAGSILVVYGGVIQQPGVAFSLSAGGNTITFSEAPVTGTTLFIIYLGKQLVVQGPVNVGAAQSLAGNGSNTAFTLDYSVTDNEVLIFVNGVYFHPVEDYSVTATTLTFVTAPDDGSEIRIRFLKSNLVNTTDAVFDLGA